LLTLRAEPRGTTKGSRSGARRQGLVPGVVYGKDVAPTPIAVPGAALREAMKAGARHRMIRLAGAGMDTPRTVLIKDIQFDNVHLEVVHVDFFEPAAGRRFHVRVPVIVQGDDQLTKRGIIMEHHLGEVDCECMPDNVPEAIYVDVSACEPGQHVALGELRAPTGVRITGDPRAVVCVIEAPMATIIPGEGMAQVTAGE
jgi:large subunit ribosomal protein L25